MGIDATELAAAHRTALELADLADDLALARFRGPLSVSTKPDGSHITEADTAIERAVREQLARAHADHAVLGEEDGGALDPDRPTWVVDPIDGTANFLRGVPVFATLIALVVEGTAVVGVSSAPAIGERVEGARGQGVRRNGRPVQVSRIADLSEAHVAFGGLDRLRAEPLWSGVETMIDTAWRTRGFGDFWSHAMVACGSVDVAFEREVELWDIAALCCLVEESGGRITDGAGRSPLEAATAPSRGEGIVVSSNGWLHEATLEMLNG